MEEADTAFKTAYTTNAITNPTVDIIVVFIVYKQHRHQPWVTVHPERKRIISISAIKEFLLSHRFVRMTLHSN